MCLQAQGTDNNDSGIVRVRRDHGISNDDGGVGREQGIRYASEGLETTAETTRARQWARGIYDDDVGVGGGK